LWICRADLWYVIKTLYAPDGQDADARLGMLFVEFKEAFSLFDKGASAIPTIEPFGALLTHLPPFFPSPSTLVLIQMATAP
jgi:hypothetical protein